MFPTPAVPNPADFDVSLHTGFATERPIELPAYYAPWHALITALPRLLDARTVRSKVDDLEVLGTQHLTSTAHWQRAFVTLGFLIQAYIWQDKSHPSAIVPPSLADPYLRVCSVLEIEPALSYTGLCLWNWTPLENHDGLDPASCLEEFDKLEAFASFTGSRDEDAFYLVPVMIEAKGGRLIGLLLDALRAEGQSSTEALITLLNTAANILESMGDLFSILHQHCDPELFYHEIRPMLAGSRGMQEKGLPVGVTFHRNDGSKAVVSCVGGSAAQSSLFPFLDHVFGVTHTSPMLQEMRPYMSRQHREFLREVETLPSLRAVMGRFPASDEMTNAFLLVLDTFRQWRTKHIAVVTRYIVRPAAVAAKGTRSTEEKGTAGSLPIPFLKQFRDETVLPSLRVLTKTEIATDRRS